VKIYVGLYRVIGLELSQGRKWRKQKFAHYSARAVACDLHSGLQRLTGATAVTADIRNFLQIFHTNSNRCFRLCTKPSFFPLTNQDDGSSSNTCVRGGSLFESSVRRRVSWRQCRVLNPCREILYIMLQYTESTSSPYQYSLL